MVFDEYLSLRDEITDKTGLPPAPETSARRERCPFLGTAGQCTVYPARPALTTVCSS